MTGPIVIKVGGTAVENQASAPKLWDAIAALHARTPAGVVLVHGGGKAVDRHLIRLGIVSERREGIRLTPPEHMDEIAAVLAGVVNSKVAGALSALGVRAVGLRLGDGLPTVRTSRYGFDPGCVGEVVDRPASPGNLFALLLRARFLPVLSSIGYAPDGTLLNLNADDAAAGAAAALGASTLVLMTDVPGVLDAQRRVVPELTRAGVERLIASEAITGGMVVKVRAACDAADRTGAAVVILNGNDPDALGEWASGKPAGTRILPG